MNASPPHALLPRDFAERAAAFAALHANRATRPFATNIEARIETLDLAGLKLPVTINDAAHTNAWVVSPRTAYTRYAREECERHIPRWFGAPLSGLIGLTDRWLAAIGFDEAVTVNNWMLSTNLYPCDDTIDVDALVHACLTRWPERAIWLRSLNDVQHRGWLRRLREAGFDLIASRHVYLFRDLAASTRQPQNLRRDLQLLRTTNLKRVDHAAFTRADFAAAAHRYAQLYNEKYSEYNPRYTAQFLEAWHRAGLLEFTGFKDEAGELRAVVGLFGQDDVLTAPIVGYDTTWPQSAGLYRLLIAHTLRTAIERRIDVNLSAGAAHFKRLRGGQAAIEYSAVLNRHLPRPARRAFSALRALTAHIGIPIMKRLAL
jgi:hypothetical protein